MIPTIILVEVIVGVFLSESLLFDVSRKVKQMDSLDKTLFIETFGRADYLLAKPINYLHISGICDKIKL